MRIRRFVFNLLWIVWVQPLWSAPFEASAPGLLTVTGGSGGGCGQSVPMRWSDPDTWGGNLPVANDSVNIPACETIILDVVTPSLGIINIDGTLVADPSVDVGIMATSIYVKNGGTLQIGTVSQPYTRNATITLTGARGTHTPRNTGPLADNALDNDGLSRALRVMNGGALRLFGATPPLTKTKLNAHANAGANSFTLADNVNWRAGDRVAIGITDFHGVGQTEILTLANNTSGNSMTTTSGLATSRWGRLQYVTDNGMSLTPGAFNPPSPITPTVLDQRAEVVNLSRRIVIQGADDADWQTQGFGAHVMIMGLASIAQARGVEFRRVGQRRAMGRYPWHWHMLSYTAANAMGVGGGQYLGDAITANHFLEKSAVWDSQNRAVTIHGTNGVMVDDVYAVDIKGHAFFFEDGVEERNTVQNCVAMKVRDPGLANRLKVHDGEASGFWMTNPNNTIEFNTGLDTDGRGLWNSFSTQCFGLSRNAPINPSVVNLLKFDDNTGHSNWLQGLATNFNVVDEAGNTSEWRYIPASLTFTMSRNITWKNKHGGYANRVEQPRYMGWTAADNEWSDFAGATGNNAFMNGTLSVGRSLNSATPHTEPRIAYASYHYALDITSVTVVNFPFASPVLYGSLVTGQGAFNGADLYTMSVAISGIRNVGWKLIGSSPGALIPPPYFDGFPLSTGSGQFRYWSLPGAIWDPHGYWGPAGNYLLPSTNLFFTYGLSSSVPVAPAGQNGVSTPDIFYGVGDIIRNNEPNNYITLRCGRLNTSNVEIAEHTIGNPSQSQFLPNMRHFTVAKNGRYRITFPGETLPSTALNVRIGNAYRTSDSFLVAVPWQGSVPVAGQLDAGDWDPNLQHRLQVGSTRLFTTTGNSIQDVLNDPTGVTIWQDSANNLVWIKHVGGLVQDLMYELNTDMYLERPYFIRLRPA